MRAASRSHQPKVSQGVSRASRTGTWALAPKLPSGVRTLSLPAWLTSCLPSALQEGFAPPEDDEIEEHQQEDQDEY